MAVFEYRGLTAAGKSITGMKEADSAKSLRHVLRKDGVFLTDVIGQAEGSLKGASKTLKPQGGLSGDINLRRLARGRVNTADVAVMTRQLATLLAAGVSLIEALAAMVDQVEKEQLKRVLSDVKQNVNEGKSLADALHAHLKIFGALYINMIRAGESSGALDAVLVRLAEFTEGQAKLRQKIIGTMIYPMIMMVIGGGVLFMLMTVVVPKVTKIFTDMKVVLPWTTRLLIFTSNLLQDFWFLIIPGVVGAVLAFGAWTRSASGKPTWDAVVLKLPVFGALTALLEPMVIVMMGIVIAFVAMSIMMPILQMNTMVH